jgi:hypothetical protein
MGSKYTREWGKKERESGEVACWLCIENFCYDRPNPILQVCDTKVLIFLYPIFFLIGNKRIY